MKTVVGMVTHAVVACVASFCSADDLAAGHPRPSYEAVRDIDGMAKAVRNKRYPIHRGGWEWDRLLARYIDGGRKEKHALFCLKLGDKKGDLFCNQHRGK